MELADGREGRARRANAGNLLQQLLEQGLDAEEEQLLQALDEDTSDSSFTASDVTGASSASDVFDSDFSDEEEEGILEGEQVETEVMAQREDRKARQQARRRELQRVHDFARKGGGGAMPRGALRQGTAGSPQPGRRRARGDGSGTSDDEEQDLRQTVRRRRPPTIPLEQRLAEALARAEERTEDGEAASAATAALLSSRLPGAAPGRRRRGAGRKSGVADGEAAGSRAGGDDFLTAGSGAGSMSGAVGDWNHRMWLYAGSRGEPRHPQRVQYHSSARVLSQLGTPVVYSFSSDLPPVFSRS